MHAFIGYDDALREDPIENAATTTSCEAEPYLVRPQALHSSRCHIAMLPGARSAGSNDISR